jgi:hypothetical protein
MSEWNTFEFMDRAATVELLIAELLTDHPVGEHPELAAKLTALEEAAGALYQAAGTHHHTLTPAKPEQVDHFGDSNEMVAAEIKAMREALHHIASMPDSRTVNPRLVPVFLDKATSIALAALKAPTSDGAGEGETNAQ